MTLLTIPLRRHFVNISRVLVVRVNRPSKMSCAIPNGFSRSYNIVSDTEARIWRLGPFLVAVLGCYVTGIAPQEDESDFREWATERTATERPNSCWTQQDWEHKRQQISALMAKENR